jgi:glycosyltransferase involved in cell wall biosynthesis
MEGFGFPPLEAMACGTPAIVSDRGAIPEVTGGAAVIVSPGDTAALSAAMRRVIEEPAFRAHLAELGRVRAANFSYEAGARALLQVYEELR